jgi:hypothetical protein
VAPGMPSILASWKLTVRIPRPVSERAASGLTRPVLPRRARLRRALFFGFTERHRRCNKKVAKGKCKRSAHGPEAARFALASGYLIPRPPARASFCKGAASWVKNAIRKTENTATEKRQLSSLS